MSRVFAGDGPEYFPDFAATLAPGDPIPDGHEVAEDDSRFVAPNSKEGRDAKARGKQLEDASTAPPDEPTEPVEAPAESGASSSTADNEE